MTWRATCPAQTLGEVRSEAASNLSQLRHMHAAELAGKELSYALHVTMVKLLHHAPLFGDKRVSVYRFPRRAPKLDSSV